ncbi:hypothetical protein AAC387_Pa12g1069 [Persea americana]
MAGIMGRRRAGPGRGYRLRRRTANAESQLLRDVKMAPAKADPNNEDEFTLSRDLEGVRPLGRFWSDSREIGFMVGLEGMTWFGEFMLKHLRLSMAIVDIVAMDAVGCMGFGLGRFFVVLTSEVEGRVLRYWYCLF